MNPKHFEYQIGRLIEVYGKTVYSKERAQLIWKQVEHESDFFMTQTVDQLIGECRQAPLLPEFREALSKHRERNWFREKKQHEQDAKDFFQSVYHPDDVKGIIGTIKKRMLGGVSDQDWESFLKLLNSAPTPIKEPRRSA